MLRLSDLKIAPESLGSKLLLTDVRPVYEYKDGVRTDRVTGYRYMTVLPEKSFEKLGVKIEGPQQLDKPDGYAEVVFDGLEIYAYVSGGQIQVGARATGIREVKSKA